MSNVFDSSGTPLSKFLELAVSVIPQRKTGIRDILRPACDYLPMPLSLGWPSNPLEDDYPDDGFVKGLVISDIASGATRPVVASWMHSLYKETWEKQPAGVTMIQLKEAHFSASFGWRHRVLIAALGAQIGYAVYGLTIGQLREGCLALCGITIQICEGLYVSKFPKYCPPRSVKKPRFYALHTAMTTTHILILVHEAGTKESRYKNITGDFRHVNLEDAAVPLIKHYRGQQRRWARVCAFALELSGWIYRAVCVLTASNGYLLPIVMLFGSIVKESLSLFPELSLPKSSEAIFLDTIKEPKPASILDRLLATCQATGSVSIGFVESILPDPNGKHVDYTYINENLTKGSVNVGKHPNHQTAEAVHDAALKRRTTKPCTVPTTIGIPERRNPEALRSMSSEQIEAFGVAYFGFNNKASCESS